MEVHDLERQGNPPALELEVWKDYSIANISLFKATATKMEGCEFDVRELHTSTKVYIFAIRGIKDEQGVAKLEKKSYEPRYDYNLYDNRCKFS